MNLVSKISENRVLLMALAIIFVVIYHFKCWIGGFPWYIGIIIKYGYIGVDIFFFLSGFGLTYSFQKNNIKTFYKNRLKKILPCYILYGFILVLHMFFHSSVSLSWYQIIYKFSCMEYLFEHKGIDWFVNAIIILYVLFPIFFKLMKILREYILILIVPVIWLITINCDLHWTHLAMLHIIPMFLFGIYCALNFNKDRRIINISLLYFIYFIITLFISNKWGFLCTTLVTPLIIYIILKLNIKKDKYNIKIIGANTLQIYYGTNLALLSYDYLYDSGRSVKAIIFFLFLIFGSYLFSWITKKSNDFISHSI